ncbi:MurR/RpiR family transcriptional regulator [Jhaorihella thermophila]
MDPTLKSRTVARLKVDLERFTPRMQLAAKYVLDNPVEFGLDPIRETARKAGVSTYTLVRIAEHLGFDGFEEFRAPFRHALLSAGASADRPGWVAGLRARGEAGRFQADVSANALSIVERSLERLGPETLDRAAEIPDVGAAGLCDCGAGQFRHGLLLSLCGANGGAVAAADSAPHGQRGG